LKTGVTTQNRRQREIPHKPQKNLKIWL